MAAERIVNVCRSYSDGRFEVLVPHMAKSAATMVCFGAERIHMSETAELGPVDPQIPYIDDRNQEIWTSADEYVRSYENLITEATTNHNIRIEPLLQQLGRYDSRHIEQLKSVQQLCTDISAKLLSKGMMSGDDQDTICEKIAPFLSQEQLSAHGRMITASEAKKIGLKIKTIDLRSNLWKWSWELFIRTNWVVTNRASKVLESENSSLVSI